jgi:hypothetical protein
MTGRPNVKCEDVPLISHVYVFSVYIVELSTTVTAP